MTTRPIYLDYAATAPLDPRVRERMLTWLSATDGFGNAAAVTHDYGRAAAEQIARSAAEVASLVNGDPDYVIWTSGATESDNLGIIGAARYRESRGRHVVTSRIEHKAVLGSCAELERQGFRVTYLSPDEYGVVAPAAVAAALEPDTLLVSIAHANNEIGTVQDIGALGALCRGSDVWLHVDAAQTLGKLPLDMAAQQIDLLTLNAHKACGPQGVGALLLNPASARRVAPLLFGGGQQRGIRPGTLPVHQIAGMGAACSLLATEMAAEVARVRTLRDELWEGIRDVPGVLLNGHPEQRLASLLNISVAGVEGESLRLALGELAVASGSACTSAAAEPSYVLRSLGRSDTLAEASIRFSLGRFTQPAEISRAIAVVRDGIRRLQALAPAAGEVAV